MLTTHASFWDDYLDPLKVTFDGENRYIYVNPQYSLGVRIKQDLYAASKRWLARRRNSAYPAPLRGIGGDSLGNGLYAGDIYFLTNNWRVVIDHPVYITGTLFQDNVSIDTYTVLSGGGVVSTVSSQAYAYSTTGVTVPTAAQVATEVWGTATLNLTNPATVGGQLVNTNSTVANIKINTDNIIALVV